jgi:hypothetical protein
VILTSILTRRSQEKEKRPQPTLTSMPHHPNDSKPIHHFRMHILKPKGMILLCSQQRQHPRHLPASKRIGRLHSMMTTKSIHSIHFRHSYILSNRQLNTSSFRCRRPTLLHPFLSRRVLRCRWSTMNLDLVSHWKISTQFRIFFVLFMIIKTRHKILRLLLPASARHHNRRGIGHCSANIFLKCRFSFCFFFDFCMVVQN